MPWGDLVELLGGSAMVLAVLAVFWKGDDCISKEFRDDLAAWLILLKPPPGNSPVAQSVLAMFEKVFGDRHWSWQCFSRSFALSTVFVCLISTFFYLRYLDYAHESYGTDESGTLVFVQIVFIFGIFYNGVGDYPALYITRVILNRCAKSDLSLPWAMFLDFLLTSLSVFAVIFFLALVEEEYFYDFETLSQTLRLTSEFILVLILGEGIKDHSYSLDGLIFFRAVAFTAFITSFWLWAAALGTLLIRLLARSGPLLNALQYALPIEEKPIRSMGIVGFLVFFVYLLITIAVRSV